MTEPMTPSPAEQIEQALRRHTEWLTSGGTSGARLDLRERDLGSLSFAGAVLDRALLAGARLALVEADRVSLRQADLRDADLGGASLRKTDLTAADLSGARLERARLDRTDLTEARARRVVLDRSQLVKVVCLGTDLTDASMRECDLDRVTLDGARLSGVDVTGMAGSMVAPAEPIVVEDPQGIRLLSAHECVDWLTARGGRLRLSDAQEDAGRRVVWRHAPSP